MLNMGFVFINEKNKVVMSRYMEKNWWVIGLRPFVNKTWEDVRGNLTMIGVINFEENTGMADVFDKAIRDYIKNKNGIDSFQRFGNIFKIYWHTAKELSRESKK
jgi:hypothetical protein